MPPQERLWLNNQQRVLPGPNGSCQEYQEQPIRFGKGGSFHVPTEDDERLSEEGVFSHQFGLASGKVCQRPQQERSGGRFRPVSEAVVERLKAKAYRPRDEGENSMHSVRYPF